MVAMIAPEATSLAGAGPVLVPNVRVRLWDGRCCVDRLSPQPILLKNSNGRCPQATTENVDLIERPRIADRHSVDVRRPPKRSSEYAAQEFFNRIGQERSFGRGAWARVGLGLERSMRKETIRSTSSGRIFGATATVRFGLAAYPATAGAPPEASTLLKSYFPPACTNR